MRIVKATMKTKALSFAALIGRRRNLSGSLIGGIAETQRHLDFCAEHNVTADIEKIPMSYLETAYERMLKSDIKYRFVIDMALLGN
jgi:alcohol dehydrogenase (NADP+)